MTQLLLRVSGTDVRAEVRGFGHVLWAAEAAAETPEQLAEAIAALAEASPRRLSVRRTRLEFDRPLVQVRQLRGLPPTRSAHLRRLVAAEPSRFFRGAVELVTDACWSESLLRRRRTTATGVAVERAWVDAAVSALAAAGAGPQSVGVPRTVARGIDLSLPAQSAAKRKRAMRRAAAAAAIAAAIWVINIALSAASVRAQLAEAEAEIAELRAPVDALRDARVEIETAASMVTAVAADGGRGAEISRALARIALALPDSAYLDAVAFDSAGGATISGEAAATSAVAEALRVAGAVGLAFDRRPGAATMTPGGWSRFSLRMERAP